MADGNIVITGSDAVDDVTVTYEGGGSGWAYKIPQYRVVENGVTTGTYSAYSFYGPKKITFHGHGGNDKIHNYTGLDLTANGGWGNDELYGGGGADFLDGWIGNDYLDGGVDGVADTLKGGANSDTFVEERYRGPGSEEGDWSYSYNLDEPSDFNGDQDQMEWRAVY